MYYVYRERGMYQVQTLYIQYIQILCVCEINILKYK